MQDTITGIFLLAGVGNVDSMRETNYLVVDSSMFSTYYCDLIAEELMNERKSRLLVLSLYFFLERM